MKKGVKLVLLTAIISGFSIFFNAFGVNGIDSSIFTFLKNVIVSLFLLSIFMLFGKFNEIKELRIKQWLQLGVIGLIGGSIPFLLFFKGLQLSTGPTGAFIHKSLFIYSTILAVFFLKEKISWKVIVPTILLIIGNYFLLKMTSFSFGLGESLILVATLFWAAENVISKYVLKDLSGNVVAFGRMFFGSLFILVFLTFTGKLQLISNLGSSQLVWIFVTSLFLFGYVTTYYNGLKTVNVATATSILLLGSPITFLLNFVFLGKTIAPLSVLGGIFVIVGSVLFVYLNERSITQEIISTA